MNFILHIDTSGKTGVIAISSGGKPLTRKENTQEKDHAATINLLIEEVLAAAGIPLKEIAAVSIIGGPGSYTGLRIGLATAKALCYVLNIPLMMENKLELLTLQQCLEHRKEFEYYYAVLPAREKEYFISVYNNNCEKVLEPRHILEEDLIHNIQGRTGKLRFSGVLNKTIIDIAEKVHAEYIECETIDLEFWCTEAFKKYNCNGFVNLANAEPFYLKQVFTHKSK